MLSRRLLWTTLLEKYLAAVFCPTQALGLADIEPPLDLYWARISTHEGAL